MDLSSMARDRTCAPCTGSVESCPQLAALLAVQLGVQNFHASGESPEKRFRVGRQPQLLALEGQGEE